MLRRGQWRRATVEQWHLLCFGDGAPGAQGPSCASGGLALCAVLVVLSRLLPRLLPPLVSQPVAVRCAGLFTH